MFTGIIQAVGRIHDYEAHDAGARMVVDVGTLDLSDVAIGDSIAVNGVCLTAVALGPARFTADVSAETLRCTRGFAPDAEVNLEKALRLADRLGGHLMSGHVDGVGRVAAFEAVGGGSWKLAVDAPDALARYIAAKGSIGIDGVSLTVNAVSGTRFDVNLIPHTLEMTALKRLAAGHPVNLEIDLIARYVARMASFDASV
jgi:riboflavin synthase